MGIFEPGWGQQRWDIWTMHSKVKIASYRRGGAIAQVFMTMSFAAAGVLLSVELMRGYNRFMSNRANSTTALNTTSASALSDPLLTTTQVPFEQESTDNSGQVGGVSNVSTIAHEALDGTSKPATSPVLTNTPPAQASSQALLPRSGTTAVSASQILQRLPRFLDIQHMGATQTQDLLLANALSPFPDVTNHSINPAQLVSSSNDTAPKPTQALPAQTSPQPEVQQQVEGQGQQNAQVQNNQGRNNQVQSSEAERQNEVQLVVDLSDRQLTVYDGDTMTHSYPIAVGKAGWETPLGEFTVTDKEPNPTWRHPLTGEVVTAGEDSPLGTRWIGFWTDGIHQIGFHGTNRSDSIGQAISHGCIRMQNLDIETLYSKVAIGTPIRVQP